jgi:hypothetical protein
MQSQPEPTPLSLPPGVPPSSILSRHELTRLSKATETTRAAEKSSTSQKRKPFLDWCREYLPHYFVLDPSTMHVEMAIRADTQSPRVGILALAAPRGNARRRSDGVHNLCVVLAQTLRNLHASATTWRRFLVESTRTPRTGHRLGVFFEKATYGARFGCPANASREG